MQTDHQVLMINPISVIRQQHRKRSYSNINFRKRDRNDLICVVCLAPAMGYNFDQITCESCKAFFRRNALNNANKLKCRVGTNDCVITLETRKRCKYCRLKRCFDKGLRKEWIMSEEEKRNKKQKIEENRRLRAMSQSLSTLTTYSYSPSIDALEKDSEFIFAKFDEQLNDSNNSNDFKDFLDYYRRNSLVKIEEHYSQAVRLNISVIPGFPSPCLRSLSSIVSCLNEPAYISALRLITFLKLTPQFHSLHEDDKLILVKHNMISALFAHLCMCTNVSTGIFHELNTPDEFCYEVNVLRCYSDEIHDKSMKLVENVQKICSNDQLIMKLFILILLFTKGSDPYEPILVDPFNVFHAQNSFLDLLWNYLIVRFGFDQTPLVYSQLIFSLLICQSLAREVKEIVTQKSVQIDELTPLMQSVLQIS